MKRLLCALLAACLMCGLCACQAADPVSVGVGDQGPLTAFDVSTAKDLEIQVYGVLNTGASKDDKLTPIWREKTKVTPEIVSYSGNETPGQYFQMNHVAGTMPEIIAPLNGVFDHMVYYKQLKDQGSLRPITLEELETYMPRYKQRLEAWGFTMEDWYNANIDPSEGKLLYVPGPIDPLLTDAKNTSWVQATASTYNPTVWYFRDDILKTIFPETKTEAELRQLYIDNGGQLTYEEIDDVPVKSKEDLYDYLIAVQQLNLSVGEKKVVPGQIMGDTQANNIYNSCLPLAGLSYQIYGHRLFDDIKGTMTYTQATPEWKELIQWFNKIYNQGLLSEEAFIQKNEQRDAKAINGEYAVFCSWLPVTSARDLAKQENRGYGYRYVNIVDFPDLTTTYQNFQDRFLTLNNATGAVAISTSAKEADIPQLLNWIDWNYSQEADILRFWGTDDMYTGEKLDRRFTKEWEDIMLNADPENTPQDYGLYMNRNDCWNHETYGLKGVKGNYPYTPLNVYPPELENPDKINLDAVCLSVYTGHYAQKVKLWLEKPLDQEVTDLKNKFLVLQDEHAEIQKTQGFYNDGAKTATIRAIIAKPEQFDEIYGSEYEAPYLTQELLDNVKAMGDAWSAFRKLYRQSYIEPYSLN